jgi:Flp pilus assembly protein TadB
MVLVHLHQLWLPMILSAVIVFVASSLVHMVLTYHRSDYQKLPNEDAVSAAIRTGNAGAGLYMFPHMSMADMRSPEGVEKFKKGPVGFLTLRRSGAPGMGKNLVQWFIYSMFVGLLVAYVAGRTVAPGAGYLPVFRIGGTVAFLAYAGGAPIDSIWRGQPWSVTFKAIFDGLLYACLTAGTFGWLWPKM